MEETEYKSIYDSLTRNRCGFEKALSNRHACCHLAKHFCLADREGFACKNKIAAARCYDVLVKLRQNAAFVLKLHDATIPLPHNKEIRVQAGGLTGLMKSVTQPGHSEADLGDSIPVDTDIDQTIIAAIDYYGSIEALPYSEIMQSVVKFKGRRKRLR